MGVRIPQLQRLDFQHIGVLIPTLNYPLSWAQLGPLVKTPPLFVLKGRATPSRGRTAFGAKVCFVGVYFT